MKGYYTNYSSEVDTVAESYLFKESFNDPELFYLFSTTSRTRTFVSEDRRFFKCYSENLRLLQRGSKLVTQEVDFNWHTGDCINNYELLQHRIWLFEPSGKPQVFLGIHSPFIPMNPPFNGIAIRAGYHKGILVQLDKEEHLLPPPYQTGCRDNGPSEDAKRFNDPNSYQMCLEMCRSEFAKGYYGCDLGMTMVSKISDLCYGDHKRPKKGHKRTRKLQEKRLICFQKCKPECLKLHYKYEVAERELTKVRANALPGFSYTQINVINTEVTVLRHVPLYGSGELFSHVGGLLGCWLGISVFTFIDIFQKFLQKAVTWKRKFRMKKVQNAPSSEDLD